MSPLQRRAGDGVLPHRVLHVIVPESQHISVCMVDRRNLAGARQSPGDHKRASRVVCGHAFGVPYHVGVALLKPQQLVDVQARVRACHNLIWSVGGTGKSALSKPSSVAVIATLWRREGSKVDFVHIHSQRHREPPLGTLAMAGCKRHFALISNPGAKRSNDFTLRAGGAAQLPVKGQKRAVQRLGQGHIPGIVAGQVAA